MAMGRAGSGAHVRACGCERRREQTTRVWINDAVHRSYYCGLMMLAERRREQTTRVWINDAVRRSYYCGLTMLAERRREQTTRVWINDAVLRSYYCGLTTRAERRRERAHAPARATKPERGARLHTFISLWIDDAGHRSFYCDRGWVPCAQGLHNCPCTRPAPRVATCTAIGCAPREHGLLAASPHALRALARCALYRHRRRLCIGIADGVPMAACVDAPVLKMTRLGESGPTVCGACSQRVPVSFQSSI